MIYNTSSGPIGQGVIAGKRPSSMQLEMYCIRSQWFTGTSHKPEAFREISSKLQWKKFGGIQFTSQYWFWLNFAAIDILAHLE